VFKAILQFNNQHKSQLLHFFSCHTITNTQIESKGLSWLVMRLGCKQFMVFLGCKQKLGSKRVFILRSTLFLLFPTFIEMTTTFKALSLSNNTHILLFLKYFFSSCFTCRFLTQFLCGCYLSYHNYHHPIPSPKFGTNLPWTMMLSYNLKKGRWRL